MPDFIPRPRLTTLALALALLATPVIASAADKAAPAPAKTDGNSIGDNMRSLGQQISDPKTPDRIKGHEQEFEKNVQGTRDQQRKSHPGEVRATDATDMANSPKMGGQGTKAATKGSAAAKPKASAAKVKQTESTADAKAASGTKVPAPPATPPAK